MLISSHLRSLTVRTGSVLHAVMHVCIAATRQYHACRIGTGSLAGHLNWIGASRYIVQNNTSMELKKAGDRLSSVLINMSSLSFRVQLHSETIQCRRLIKRWQRMCQSSPPSSVALRSFKWRLTNSVRMLQSFEALASCELFMAVSKFNITFTQRLGFFVISAVWMMLQ